MSTLDFIRSLRRTLAALREARDPVAVALLARSLANELEADLLRHPVVADDQDAFLLTRARDGVLLPVADSAPGGMEMAVFA